MNVAILPVPQQHPRTPLVLVDPQGRRDRSASMVITRTGVSPERAQAIEEFGRLDPHTELLVYWLAHEVDRLEAEAVRERDVPTSLDAAVNFALAERAHNRARLAAELWDELLGVIQEGVLRDAG